MASSDTAEEVLAALDTLNAEHEITILKLSEPITATLNNNNNNNSSNNGNNSHHQRTSDISTSSLQQFEGGGGGGDLDLATTPSSLEADLTHYRELFAKLRFSYVEQVTKEKFIRAIVGDPPLIVTPQENVDLEQRNLAAKAALKALKTEVAAAAAALEERARDLARRHEGVRLETAQLRELPAKTAELEVAVATLRAKVAPGIGGVDKDKDGGDGLFPLARTLELVEERQRQRADLDRQLEQLQARALPRKRKELERLQAELLPLEAKRQSSTAAAREARRRKEEALGGVEDDLEERGRWYRAADASLRQMLELEGGE